MGRLLWWANIALALATLLALLSPYVAPGRLWPVAFAGLAFPSLVLAHLAAFTWYLLRKRRRFWLSAVCLILSLPGINALVGFGESPHDSKDEQEETLTLTLVNYNLLGGARVYSDDVDAFRQNLDRLNEQVFEGADLVALEETPSYRVVRDSISLRMNAAGVRYHYFPPGIYISLHSRYRLMEPEVLAEFNQSNAVLTALVSPREGDTLRVFAAHLQSNSVRLDGSDMMRQAARNSRRVYWKMRKIARNYRSAARSRARQAAQIAKAIRASRYPIILLGDLNDTPQSFAVNELLRAGLSDSFSESGTGIGVSYPGTIPGLRIDYLLASEQFHWRKSEVIDIDLSDHRPVRAVLELPEPVPAD